VLKVGGQLKWRRNKEIRQPSFSKKSRWLWCQEYLPLSIHCRSFGMIE
jgi:hypothetical protein